MNHCGQVGCTTYFVSTTHAAEVKHWATRDELLAFLGPIDSPEDALLLAYFDGYDVGHAPELGCDAAAVRAVEGGYEIYATKTTSDCAPIRVTRYLLFVSPSGQISEKRSATASETSACVGRRPEGLRAQHVEADSLLGEYFARHAGLEAAAVYAFDIMVDELRVHGAPASLVRDAAAARTDELRHAELIGRLAARFRARVPDVHVDPLPARSLLAMEKQQIEAGRSSIVR